jgi:hypothetical protein
MYEGRAANQEVWGFRKDVREDRRARRLQPGEHEKDPQSRDYSFFRMGFA